MLAVIAFGANGDSWYGEPHDDQAEPGHVYTRRGLGEDDVAGCKDLPEEHRVCRVWVGHSTQSLYQVPRAQSPVLK